MSKSSNFQPRKFEKFVALPNTTTGYRIGGMLMQGDDSKNADVTFAVCNPKDKFNVDVMFDKLRGRVMRSQAKVSVDLSQPHDEVVDQIMRSFAKRFEPVMRSQYTDTLEDALVRLQKVKVDSNHKVANEKNTRRVSPKFKNVLQKWYSHNVVDSDTLELGNILTETFLSRPKREILRKKVSALVEGYLKNVENNATPRRPA